METFGERLKRLRARKELSVRELENQAGITHGVVSRLENQQNAFPSVRVAMRLAKVLGVSLDYLCGMDYDSNQQPAAEGKHGDAETPSGSTESFADNGAHSMQEVGKE